ncbi:MAG TPA: polysaccharide deacetylase family protein [Pyrinomonadaceae bacterium]|nr:polysaccharide deacetylase family protein [Pyrinomonadaceae bacterium]
MKRALTATLAGFILVAAVAAQKRTIAITIDDLPVITTSQDLKLRREIIQRILDHLKAAKVPAIGFVNENKLFVDGKRDKARVALLQMWVDADIELGNHGYAHRSLNNTPLDEYEADLLKGETITNELLKPKGHHEQFYRHPFLHTGRSMEVKQKFDDFLREHGYRIAPVSFDNSDYIFARAFDNARDAGDKAALKKVGAEYIPYMEGKLDYWERQSVKLFAREISQTVLLHANSINAEYLGDLIAMFKRRGYACVTLEAALHDDAYQLADTYVGDSGISWLHRWALERGKEFVLPDEPRVSPYVLKVGGFEHE